VASTIEDKLELACDHFQNIMGSVPNRNHLLNLDQLNLRHLSADDAMAQEVPFSREEVRKVIIFLVDIVKASDV
jgi:hypothetical protein